MEFSLDKQLESLSLTIKSLLEKKDQSSFHYEDVKCLFEAQKALLETMLMAKHLEGSCRGGGCCEG